MYIFKREYNVGGFALFASRKSSGYTHEPYALYSVSGELIGFYPSGSFNLNECVRLKDEPVEENNGLYVTEAAKAMACAEVEGDMA